MCPLRRVEATAAGPAALGVLVPPGKRTFVILRPRGLAWDLVLLRPDEPAFDDLSAAAAAAAASRLLAALEDWCGGTADGRVETAGRPGGWRLSVRVGPFTLLACPRLPGQPYRPLVLGEGAEAAAAARALAAVLCPGPGVEQEVYCNLRFFDPQPEPT